jgi:hypothetical protein
MLFFFLLQPDLSLIVHPPPPGPKTSFIIANRRIVYNKHLIGRVIRDLNIKYKLSADLGLHLSVSTSIIKTLL